MLEILQFIFSDFWTWFGTYALIIVLADSIVSIIKILRRK